MADINAPTPPDIPVPPNLYFILIDFYQPGENYDTVRDALRNLGGLGMVTTNFFLVLSWLNWEDVKQYVADAVGDEKDRFGIIDPKNIAGRWGEEKGEVFKTARDAAEAALKVTQDASD